MCAMPGRNPYRPGVGTMPLFFAGRGRELRRFRSTLRAAPEIPANVRLTGLRGVGKTVLLTRFRDVGQDEGWETGAVELEPRHEREEDLLKVLRRVLQDVDQRISLRSRARERLRGATRSVGQLALTIEGVTVRVDPVASAAAPELSAALLAVARAAAAGGSRGVLLLLDEAQVLRDDRRAEGKQPLSMLLAAVAGLQRQEVPLGLVLCGLPTLTTNLLAARTYSERMFRGEHVARLLPPEARAALHQPLNGTDVEIDDELSDAVLEAVEGYPYFLQLWGAELWDAADAADVQHLSYDLLDAISDDIYRRLDLDFYEPRIASLTPAEADVLLASGECPYPPLRVSDLNARSEKTSANVNVLLGRLVEAGVLYRPRKGQYEYTAPRFHEFLERRRDAVQY